MDAQLTDRGAALLFEHGIPASITMDPAGIDLFHALLHMVYAHQVAPPKLTESSSADEVHQHHQAAAHYVLEHVRRDKNGEHVLNIEAGHEGFVAVYSVLHRSRPVPRVYLVDPRKPFAQCLSARTPSGTIVEINLDQITLTRPKPVG